MTGQKTSYNIHPYTIDEIPKFNINYRELIKYARSVGKPVIDLSDTEKNRFIIGNTMDDVRRESIKL